MNDIKQEYSSWAVNGKVGGPTSEIIEGLIVNILCKPEWVYDDVAQLAAMLRLAMKQRDKKIEWLSGKAIYHPPAIFRNMWEKIDNDHLLAAWILKAKKEGVR